MLTLYLKTGCKFCAKVLDAGKELNLTFLEKNIADEGVEEELMERGGMVQAPYLVDDEGPVEMYESDDIVKYLHQTYGNGAVDLTEDDGSRTDSAPGTCTISDE